MTDIEWGPAIAVDGKRPGWLKNGEAPIRAFIAGAGMFSGWSEPHEYHESVSDNWKWVTDEGQPRITKLMLPADHPHYRQPAPIDWSGELEATDGNGKVWRVEVKGMEDDAVMVRLPYGFAPISWDTPIGGSHWEYNKEHNGVANSWLPVLRNVTPQPTPQADTKPDVTARMEALVRRMAGEPGRQLIAASDGDYAEARTIVAMLPEPVDPLEEAKTVLDVFLAAYEAMPDTTLVERGLDDDLLTYGHLRTISRALAGEKGK